MIRAYAAAIDGCTGEGDGALDVADGPLSITMLAAST